MTSLYRATSDSYRGAWSCWSPSIATAEAYRDNPGYGGAEIIETDRPTDYVLDLRGESSPMRALAEAIETEIGIEAYDLLQDWSDCAYVYEVWERRTAVRELLPTLYDWVCHDQETYPEGATTYVRLVD